MQFFLRGKLESIYFVRRSENWAKTYSVDCQDARQLEQTWNSVFNINYANFRQKLNAIRLENVKNCKGFSEIVESYDFDKNKLKEKNHLILPTDDDDWFHDDIVELVENKLQTDKIAIRWRYLQWGNEYLNLKKNDKWRPYFYYQTNNYALCTPFDFSLINNHGIADKNYDYWSQNNLEQFVDENWSIHNKSYASRSFWGGRLDRESLLNAAHQSKDLSIPAEVPYVFHKYIDMLNELTHKLLKIKKCLFL